MSMQAVPAKAQGLTVPFEVGQDYTREQVRKFLGGGNPQAGIVYWARNRSVVACFTDPVHGERSGYLDHENPDGSWDYCGQGLSGSQKRSGANLVLENAQVVLLFEKAKKDLHTYRGQFTTGAPRDHVATSGKRNGDTLLIFTLTPSLF